MKGVIMENQQSFSVRQVAEMTGITIRALHIYDDMNLLKPLLRTEAGYRRYGKTELLRLQQILFYKELDIPLAEIKSILDNPNFDIVKALQNHHAKLEEKKYRIEQLLTTINQTLQTLEGEIPMNFEELYRGFDKAIAEEYRTEVIEKYGSETVEESENYLLTLSKANFEELQKQMSLTLQVLYEQRNNDPEQKQVQILVEKYYVIIRQFWGTHNSTDTQKEQFTGLGQLYVNDKRFKLVNNEYNEEFAVFISKAMKFFAEHSL